MRRSDTHDAIPIWAMAGIVLVLMVLMVMLSSRTVVTAHRLSVPGSDDASLRVAACQTALRQRLGTADRRRVEITPGADSRAAAGGQVRIRAVPDGPGTPVHAAATEYDCRTERRGGRYIVTSPVRRR